MWSNLRATLNLVKTSEILRVNTSIQHLQTRNTFILKRRWPPGLHKKNGKPKVLRGRHYVYDLVEDTTIKPKPLLDIILTSYVEGLGTKGDVVRVKPMEAYNKLLLPKLGVYNTPENIQKYVVDRENKNEPEEHSSPYAAKTINALRRICLTVIMNKETPWTIEPWHIRASFRKAGYHVAEEAIKLPPKPISGPDMSLEEKEFFVTVTINNLESTPVRCRIHHWSTKTSDRVPYLYEYWKYPTGLVFPEDESISKSLPSVAVQETNEAENI